MIIFNILREIKSLFADKKLRFWLWTGIIFNLIAAIFSDGFLHWDEYFEILEFMNFKLGGTPREHLSFEYGIKMRPWLQPFLYFHMTKMWTFLGIKNPFIWTMSFRLLSAILGQISILLMSVLCIKWNFGEKVKKYIIILLNILWFLPFIHARISCETVGGSLFTIAFALTMFHVVSGGFKKNNIPILLSMIIGIIFGMAFNMRYHIGIMIFTFFLWALIFKKLSIKTLFFLSLGVFASIGLSLLVDYWGYETFVFAPYEYFKENLIHDRASYWGRAPWWDYFRLILKKGIAPVGIFIIAGSLLFWIFNPKHPITWTTLPFFVIHSYIAHKEVRFLFPLAHYIPFMIVSGFMAFHMKHRNFLQGHHFPIIGKTILVIAFLTNFILIIPASFKSAHSSLPFFKYTWNMEKPFKKLYILGDLNPYGLAALNVHFYNFHNPETINIKNDDYDQVKNILEKEKQIWVFSSRGKHFTNMNKIEGCVASFLSYPTWLLKLKPKRSRVLALYKCTL